MEKINIIQQPSVSIFKILQTGVKFFFGLSGLFLFTKGFLGIKTLTIAQGKWKRLSKHV